MNARGMKKKFKIFVRGKNYLWQRESEPARKWGFYTTVFVEARNQEEAEAVATQLLQNDPKLLCNNGVSDPPVLHIEEVSEVASFEKCKVPRTGLCIYPEES